MNDSSRLTHRLARMPVAAGCLGWLAAALLSVPLWAGSPQAVIHGPTQAEPLELVALDASQSQSADNGLLWFNLDRPEKRVLTFEGGRKAVVLAPATGRVRLLLVALDLADGSASADQRIWTIEVTESPQPPQPEPGSFGLTSAVRVWLQLVDPDARRIANELATNFETVAASVAAGAIVNPAEIIAETNRRNVATTGNQRAAWAGFWESLRRELNRLAEAKRLTTAADHAAAWREIAAGLKSASQRKVR